MMQTGRSGFTTGSCAAAAAKGAALLLLNGEIPSEVEIVLPGGESGRDCETRKLSLSPVQCELFASSARCAVRKDSGDDPDSTDGMLIFAEVSLSSEPGIVISGGNGIGRITRKGLAIPPGEWAINPVPRRMIRDELLPLAPDGKGLAVTISAPEGEDRAKKTWNPRLGIEGGISILGTTGIVEPKSTAAYLASIDLCISAAHAFDSPRPGTLFLVPGYVGEKTLLERFSVPPEIIVKMGDHVGHALKECAARGVPTVHLFGHVGKWAKVAAGLFNTHCDSGDARLETLSACAGAIGASPEQIRTLLSLPLAEEAVSLLTRWGLHRTFSLVAERAHRRCTLYTEHRIALGVTVLSLSGEILGSFPEIPIPPSALEKSEELSWEDLPSSV